MSPDPSLFLAEAIDPETAAFNASLEEILSALPPTETQEPAAVREARAAGRGPTGPVVHSPNAVERSIAGPGGPLSLRCFLPAEVRGVYLHFHGGGWVLGANDLQDPRLEALSNACNLAVLSLNYRLAPENPYPAGPDDCEAAALWLLKNAASEFGTETLIVGGESAGAHLSVVTLLRLRDRHGVRPFAAANLSYGVYDLSETPSLANWGSRRLVLNTPVMRWFFDHYVPAERRREPDVSPLYADLHGMPPALFSVGTLDPLLDDTLFMHARWLAAGNRAELRVYPGGVHGLDSYPTPVGKSCQQQAHAFLRSVVENRSLN